MIDSFADLAVFLARLFIPGFDEFVREAHTRYPNASASNPIDWRAVLGFGPREILTREQIQKRFRELAKVHHPDKGGSHDQFVKIVAAYELGIQQAAA